MNLLTIPLRLVAVMVFLSLGLVQAQAVRPDEVLADPQLEQRARDLSAELRCMVCQNQSIDGSDAELARDLRVLVRERLVAGDTDAQVIDFVVSRYGEFVLLKPKFNSRNAVLWATPAILLALGGAVLVLTVRRRRKRVQPVALSDEESEALRKMLQERE